MELLHSPGLDITGSGNLGLLCHATASVSSIRLSRILGEAHGLDAKLSHQAFSLPMET